MQVVGDLDGHAAHGGLHRQPMLLHGLASSHSVDHAEAVNLAQNRQLWRLFVSGAMHS